MTGDRFMKRILLLGSLLLPAHTASADQLPGLSSGGPESLPTLGSGSTSVVSLTDRSFSATCYLGNPNDKQSLGTITVTTSQEAGINCNSMYFSCKGRCYGCYSDFDMSEDICVDNSGRRFLR